MNKTNIYEYILNLANGDLKNYDAQLSLEQDEDGYYAIVAHIAGNRKYYARTLCEEELGETLNEAWVHTRASAKSKSTRDKRDQELRVTNRPTSDGVRYTISGLSFDQMFRLKNAMFSEAKKMREIAAEFADDDRMNADFIRFAKDAHDVAMAVLNGI